VNHSELIRQSKQTLSVPNEEISIGIQTAPEFLDEPLLFRFVEVDHDISAEDKVVTLG
jgi:hypothetical protein